MKNYKLLNKIIICIIAGVFYFAFLIFAQYVAPLFMGTEVRISIVISMVGGILIGWPCAIPVFISNLAYDLIFYRNANLSVFLGSFANALATVAILYVFKLFNGFRKGRYISDLRGLFSYIGAVIIINTLLAAFVAFLLNHYNGLPYLEQFGVTLLNNVLFSLYLGIPLLVLFQFVNKKNKKDLYTIKYLTFRIITLLSILISFLLCLIIYFIYFRNISDIILKWKQIFLFALIVLIFVFGSYALISFVFSKYVTNPLYVLTKNINTEEGMNEIDVISSKLDFICKSKKDSLNGNEFTLYIGLSTKEGKTFSYNEAKEIVNNICLNYVQGFISNIGEGGYKGEETAYASEKVLIYKIFGALDDQINSIVEEVLKDLNQESILVEKNKVNRWYIYR